MGMLYQMKREIVDLWLNIRKITVITMCTMILLISSFLLSRHSDSLFRISYALLAIPTALGLCLILILICKKIIPLYELQTIQWMDRNSFLVYLVHVPFKMLIVQYIIKNFGKCTISNGLYMIIVLSVIAFTSICTFFLILVLRYCLRLLNKVKGLQST